jgi:hypothetical protein
MRFACVIDELNGFTASFKENFFRGQYHFCNSIVRPLHVHGFCAGAAFSASSAVPETAASGWLPGTGAPRPMSLV